VRFEGFYDLAPLISTYSELPGLAKNVDSPVKPIPGLSNGRGTSDICLEVDVSVHRYVFFVKGLKDGTSTRSRFIHVRASANGELQLKETWKKPSERTRPRWIDEVCG